jgi:hypothetical protein
MVKSIFKVIMIVVVPASIIFTACKKNSSSSSNTTNNNNNAASLSANGATSDNAFDDAFNVALQVSSTNTSLAGYTSEKPGTTTLGTTTNGTGSYFCANITVSGTSFPITVTVNFGTGCKSADSITRSGSITYIFSGPLHIPGTVVSATFNNYVVNGYMLGGTYSITNSTTSATFSLTTQVAGGTITYPNDTSYSFSGSKTVSLVSGNVSNVSTLVFNITGGYKITSSYGESLTATVTTPLERKETCAFIDKGIVSFVYTKGTATLNGTLDYGDGTCDNSAVITIGSFTKTVTIP